MEMISRKPQTQGILFSRINRFIKQTLMQCDQGSGWVMFEVCGSLGTGTGAWNIARNPEGWQRIYNGIYPFSAREKWQTISTRVRKQRKLVIILDLETWKSVD